MKNLKRIFSLALAGTMLAGMLTVGASAADFTDADSIKNSEAVDTMVALNIINGKDDGSFAPEATVTRAEMAKIICVMLNGGSEPALTASASNAKFTDIGGHWAQKYIEYCVSQNVIAGRGDGTFAPDATVTGTEAAKMALTALGYNSEVFKFTGIDWQVNVNAAANAPSANLYEGLRNINPGEGLSRDNAAQMLYNALDANVVEISYNITSNGVETGYVISDSKTMMTEKFGAIKVEGIVTGNEIVTIGQATAEDEGETRIKITDVEDGNSLKLEKDNLIVVKTSTDTDVLGRTVSVYLKNAKSSGGAYQVMGSVVPTGADKVVTNTSGKDLEELADDNKLTITGVKVNPNYGTEAEQADAAPKAGDTTIMIDNDGDKKADYIFVVSYTVNQINKISTKNETVSFTGIAGAKDFEDVVGYEDVAEDDIVLVTVIAGKYYITSPTTVEGEMTEYKQDSKKTKATKLTIEGTVYDVSEATINRTNDELVAASTLNTENALDTEAVFYIDGNGRVVARGEAKETASQYAISWGGDSGSKISNQQVKLTLEDGTTKVYTLSSTTENSLRLKNGTDGAKFEVRGSAGTYTGEHDAVGTLVSYTILSNGNVRLKLAGEAANDSTFEKGKTMVGSTASTNSTVFFHVDMDGADVDEVNVYVGYKNAPSVDESTRVTLAKNAKGDRVAAVMFVDPDSEDTAKVADHLYLKSVDAVATDYTRATAVLAGSEDEVTIRLDNDDNDIYTIDADVYLYTVNSDDRYVLTAATEDDAWYKTGTLTSVSSDTVVIGGEEFYINDKTVEVDDTEDEDGIIEEGATVKMVIDTDTDEVLMIIITAPAKD